MLRYRQLERWVRGFSNHRRIQIMELLDKQSELSLDQIADKLKINYKTAGEHTGRLVINGLVIKRSEANEVRHALADRGLAVLNFLRTLE